VTAVLYAGEGAERALELAGIVDRFDSIWTGPRAAEAIEQAFESIGVTPRSRGCGGRRPEGASRPPARPGR